MIIDDDIRALRERASGAGNGQIINLCDLALDGNATARLACETRIREDGARPVPRDVSAEVLALTDDGGTTPIATVFIAGPQRQRIATILAHALPLEDPATISRATTRIAEIGPREPR